MYTSPYYTPVQRRRISSSPAGSARPASSMRATATPAKDGFLSNLDVGQVLPAITGAVGIAGNTIGMANQSLGIETEAPETGYSATGEPVYTTGSFYDQALSAKPQGATAMEAVSGFGQGAAAGASFGLPGMAIGGVIGLGASLFGGSRRKRKQEREKRKAIRSAKAAQNLYNKEAASFDQSQAAMADYYNRMDMSDRFYNLYK